MTPRSLRHPWLLGVALLAGLAVASASPSLAADVTIENVRVGCGDVANRGWYKAGTWTPLWVDVKAGPGAVDGLVEVTAPDDNGLPTRIRRPVILKANEMGTIPLFFRSGALIAEIGVRVIVGGRVKAEWPNGGAVESFGAETEVIVSAGKPVGLGELKDLAKYAGEVNGARATFLVSTISPRDGFPSRWYGYDSADVVVIDTNDADTMARLANQSQPLREWVRQGGHLVVAVGSNWQVAKGSPLEPLLPGVPAGRVELSDPGLIDQFAGTGNKPILANDAKDRLLVTKFEDWESRGAIPLAASSLTPLVLRGPYGFGRVTMIGLDVDQKPFSTWGDKKLFWDKVLDLRGRGVENGNFDSGGNAFYRAASNDLSTQLNASLQRFPGVKLVPFGWVAFFVFLYILLIGPGDYLFLRKVVKRMEYTWITFPLIVLTVSGLAYAAAYYFKGTDLRINKVDAVDLDQTTGLVRGTTWLTLFSPQNRDYNVGIAPLSPDADPPSSPIAPADLPASANSQAITSWFGSPDNPGNGGGLSLGMGGYDYAPMDEPESLQGVRVAIWSTKTFASRWSGSSGTPMLETDLVPDGPDRVRGTVTNVSKRPLRDAVLFFGRYAYLLKDIAPGATAVLGEGQTLASYMDGVTRGAMNNQAGTMNGRPMTFTAAGAGNPERADLVRSIMFHDGLGSKAGGIPNFTLRSLDLTDHLDLRRPMLVAAVDGPAAQVRLGGTPAVPKVAQTTLLRVIVALKPEAQPPRP